MFRLKCDHDFVVNWQVFLPAATKLGQGNVFTGICDSVNRGGVCLSACWDTHTPLGADPPGSRPPWSRHPSGSRHPAGADTPLRGRHPPEQTPLGADTPQSRHPLEQTPPRADTPWEQTPPGVDTPQSRHPLGKQTPPKEQMSDSSPLTLEHTWVTGTSQLGYLTCSYYLVFGLLNKLGWLLVVYF